jgi:YggT family protein
VSQLPQIIGLFFDILIWMLFARIIISWLPHNPQNAIIRLLYEGTEPILSPFRKIVPKSSLPVDLSPLIALIVLQVLRHAILRML